jgi:bacterioferritin
MSVDPRTLGWLSRALTHEMSAVQQYLAQSVLTRLWGDHALADELRGEAVEELKHAERLMERMIMMGIAPSAGNLAPARLGRSADELLAADRVLEVDAVRIYQEALAHVRRVRDADSSALLDSILSEEMSHVQALDQAMNGKVQNG